MLHVTVESFMLRHSRTVIYEPLNSLIGYSILTGGVVNRVRGIYVYRPAWFAAGPSSIIYSQQSFVIITGRRMSGCCTCYKNKDELYSFVKRHSSQPCRKDC